MKTLIEALESKIPIERVKHRLIDIAAYASDAGFYTLKPKVVVQPINEDEIRFLFKTSQDYAIPITFRTGGTSLSGQSITDGILVDLSQNWRKLTIEENGNSIRVQPGVIGATANIHLKKYQRKIGPDPSSIASAMMGGIISNNSSGMCCGVALNSFHTLKYMRFVLPNQQIFDTENQNDYERFIVDNEDVASVLTQIRKQIFENPALLEKIRNKYKTKNTVGYSLNAFVDFEHPLDIFAHLLIGGEGTLAFISEAVMNTVPEYAFKATGLLYFDDIYAACKEIKPLSEAGAAMIELMDRASLRSVENIKGIPSEIKHLSVNASALLVEFQADTKDGLEKLLNNASQLNANFNITKNFTFEPKKQAFLWKIRKGMFPAVGAVRATGTTVILEDVAFPVEKLGDAILDLQQLFTKYNYENAIIFGHAKDGNIHFVVTQSFNDSSEVARYEHFMQEVVDLVVKKYDGALKAEHGTGRNMAPFVETEWGTEAYQIMRQIKAIIDPHDLLNKGVIINADEKAHIKNLKKLPSVESEVDKCIECGACEPKCPSRDLTLTPRRRIQVRRELAILKNSNSGDYQKLLEEYQYDGLETCAVDGMCATDCPVDINTGDLVKRLRKENHSDFAKSVAKTIANNFIITEKIMRFGIGFGVNINAIFGSNSMLNITKGFRKIIPTFPLWSNQMHLAKISNYSTLKSDKKVVYYASCINRLMGSDDDKTIIGSFFSICKKADYEVIIPKYEQGNCCGQPFSSKGFTDAFAVSANKSVALLYTLSENGKIPVVMDLSSCTQTLKNCKSVLYPENIEKFDALTILDSVDFLADYILPSKNITIKPIENAVLHPVCSLQKLGNADKFAQIAQQCANDVLIPKNAGCCGMAGDRGFLFPELTQSATKAEAEEVCSVHSDGYFSSSKTCEMALSEATQKNYESIIFLVDKVLS